MTKLLTKLPGPLLFALIAAMMAGLTPALAQEEAGPVDDYLELVESVGAEYAPAFDFFTVSMLGILLSRTIWRISSTVNPLLALLYSESATRPEHTGSMPCCLVLRWWQLLFVQGPLVDAS